jgi:hypothetical protein
VPRTELRATLASLLRLHGAVPAPQPVTT